MASSDPITNESFGEEVNALLNHASFLRDQLQRSREQLESLNEMRDQNELTDLDRKIVSQLQTDLVNIVKDLDETTKKIAALVGLPAVDIENIQLNKHESEKHGITPLPYQRKSILSRVPKILVPLSEENVLRFGADEEMNDEQGRISKSLVSEEYFRAKTCWSNDQIPQGKVKDEVREKREEDPESVSKESKKCLDRLAEKDAILKNLKEQLQQRQCELMKLNAKNVHLKNKIDDIRTQELEAQETPDDDLNNDEFDERFSKKLQEKIILKDLENLREENEVEKKVQDIIKKRMKQIKKFERSYDTSTERIENVKAIPDKLNKYADKINRRNVDSVKSNENPKGDGEDNEFKGDRMYKIANLGDNEGRNYFDQALRKCYNVKGDSTDCNLQENDPGDFFNWTEADALLAIQRMGGADYERQQVVDILHKIENQKDSIEAMEAKINHLHKLLDSGDIECLVRQKFHENENSRNASSKLQQKRASTFEPHESCNTLLLLKSKMIKERELKMKCRCAVLQEAQVKASIAELRKEIASAKAARLCTLAELHRTKSQLKELTAKGDLELEQQRASKLKDCLRDIMWKLMEKREEFADKKRLVEKLSARIEHWERLGARMQFCEGCEFPGCI